MFHNVHQAVNEARSTYAKQKADKAREPALHPHIEKCEMYLNSAKASPAELVKAQELGFIRRSATSGHNYIQL